MAEPAPELSLRHNEEVIQLSVRKIKEQFLFRVDSRAVPSDAQPGDGHSGAQIGHWCYGWPPCCLRRKSMRRISNSMKSCVAPSTRRRLRASCQPAAASSHGSWLSCGAAGTNHPLLYAAWYIACLFGTGQCHGFNTIRTPLLNRMNYCVVTEVAIGPTSLTFGR